MSDVAGAILMLAGLSMLAGAIGFRVAGRLPQYQRIRLQLVAVILLTLYGGFLWNHPRILRLIPSENVVILGNWLPIWATFFVGMYVGNRRIPAGRRWSLGSLTVVLAVYSMVAPVVGKLPTCRVLKNTSARLHFQTTPYTCSAASAATLLRLHGIRATERELAPLVLTRKGTHWQGVYRGLKIKTKESDWDVEVMAVDSTTVQRLSSPCLLSLNFDTSHFDADLDHGFNSVQGHSVVFLRKSAGDYIKVFDPSPDYGVEEWGPQTVGSISGGVAFILTPRSRRPEIATQVNKRIAASLIRHNLASR